MAGAFPNLTSGAILRHPSNRKKRFPTRVIRFGSDVEKRWATARPLDGWVIGLANINGYDLSVVRAFWIAQKGRFDDTFSITIDAVTSTNMVFTDDTFPTVEQAQRPDLMSLRLEVRAVRKT